jgi:hypothetical protein
MSMYLATTPSADHCAAVHKLPNGIISTGFRGLGLSNRVKDQFDGARGAVDRDVVDREIDAAGA